MGLDQGNEQGAQPSSCARLAAAAAAAAAHTEEAESILMYVFPCNFDCKLSKLSYFSFSFVFFAPSAQVVADYSRASAVPVVPQQQS